MLRQTGSVSVGQVILGLIGRLMFIQEPGTLTCLSSLLVHILPHSKSQTHWRLIETYTNVLFDDISLSAISHEGMALVFNWTEFNESKLLRDQVPTFSTTKMRKRKKHPWMGLKNRASVSANRAICGECLEGFSRASSFIMFPITAPCQNGL